jgi:hypothetical protein
MSLQLVFKTRAEIRFGCMLFFKDQNSVGTIMKSENSLLMRNVEQDMEMLLPTLSQGERLIRVVLVVGFVVVLAIEAWLLFQVLQS